MLVIIIIGLCQIHVVYQKCDKTIAASCNCAVAVRSGDDVFVLDRCFRHTKPFNRLRGHTEDTTYLKTVLHLNGDLTPATRIHRKDDGLKYIVGSILICGCISLGSYLLL